MARSDSTLALSRLAGALTLLSGLLCGTALAAAEPNPPVVPVTRRAFVTSTTYTGNLGGMAGADAKCQARAAAAGLDNPSGFVAWISDSTTDAYCHVHGLTGERYGNCGQAELPRAAGPWVRTDGFPFAERIDLALFPTNRVLTPLLFDEFGAAIDDGSARAWTNTDIDGTLNPLRDACNDWISAEAARDAIAGALWATSRIWTTATFEFCSTERHLYCLETGAALPLPPHRSGGALVFVTSAMGTGNLSSWPQAGAASGIDAGDAICRSLAEAAGLPAPQTFVAWLSNGWTDAVDRLTLDGPWIRPDGVLVAASQADLTDGTLHAPILLDEAGFPRIDGVATGTADAGVATDDDCGDWTLADDTLVTFGLTTWADLFWTARASFGSCSSISNHLYCFSNYPAVLFVDGFESWSTGAWDGTVQ